MIKAKQARNDVVSHCKKVESADKSFQAFRTKQKEKGKAKRII
jgi:hypothetical protein